MSRPFQLRFPLLAKILAWLLLNLLLLAVAFYFVLRAQFAFGLDSLLAGLAGHRVEAMSHVLSRVLQDTSAAGWEKALEDFGKKHRVDLYLYRPDGTQVAGTMSHVPTNVVARITERRGPLEGLGRGPPPGKGPRWAWEETEAEARMLFTLRTTDPTRYWVAVRLPLREPEAVRPWPLTLVVESGSVHGHGLFFDVRPWIYAGLGALLFSALLWIPLVGGLTQSLSQMTHAAERIAEGRFDTRVSARRRDELGRLGLAINRMAERIAGFVTGQKRFLGDIAHELCSPLARIQMALGILEQKADPKQQPVLQDLREEVDEMSGLIEELLSFSRANLGRKDIRLVPVNIPEIARKVVERETAGAGTEQATIELEMPADLAALGDADLLTRALGNLVRNALRYAGSDGPIRLEASERDGGVHVSVIDHGPGVPPESLQRIFDPFFRGETSRSRQTGGAGLGLSIVKTCVETCGGTVSATNLQPRGFRVDLKLRPPGPIAP